MKKSHLFLSLLGGLVLVMGMGILFFFKPTNTEQIQGIQQGIQEVNQDNQNNNTSHNIESSNVAQTASLNNHAEQISEPINNLVHMIKEVMSNIDTRQNKIASLMALFKEAKSDGEKIAILHALSTLKPVEYVDDFILLVNSNTESNQIKAEIINLLNDSYFLSDKEVEQIGGANAYLKLEQISNFMDEVIQSDLPEEIKNQALSGYAYTNQDKAKDLAQNLLSSSTKMRYAEESMVISLMFSNQENLAEVLPNLLKNSNKLSDHMIVELSLMSSEDVVMNGLSKEHRLQIIDLLKNHQFDADSPAAKNDKEFVQFGISKLTHS